MMPNKTIYVSEDDLALYEKAKTLANSNLSATISLALGLYVAQHENKAADMHLITLKVGKVAYAMKRFAGRLLAKAVTPASQDRPGEAFEVYETAKANYVLYHAIPPSWAGFQNPVDGSWLNGQTEYRIEVFPDLANLADYVPAELMQVLNRIVSGHEVEELDI